jgi:hypothetical protein
MLDVVAPVMGVHDPVPVEEVSHWYEIPWASVAPVSSRVKFCNGHTAVELAVVVPAFGVPTQGASGIKLIEPVKKRGLFVPPKPTYAPAI